MAELICQRCQIFVWLACIHGVALYCGQCSQMPLVQVQAVIGNYAVPILEDKSVWGTNDETRTAYLDSQDVARMALAALR